MIVNYRRDTDAAEDVCGGSARTARADIRDPEQVTERVAAAELVDALVCNVDVDPPFAAFESMPWETFIGKVEGDRPPPSTSPVPSAGNARAPRRAHRLRVRTERRYRPPRHHCPRNRQGGLNTFACFVAAEAGPHGITADDMASPRFASKTPLPPAPRTFNGPSSTGRCWAAWWTLRPR